ncbi:MAG: hypothetical protein LPK09_14720 [Hymenobacteraceae bacterium]|nr:hypothetical protein [Hymenobacteraceae bacterium]
MAATHSDFFKTERTASEIKSEFLPRVFEIFVSGLLLNPSGQPTMPVPCMVLAGLDAHQPAPAAVQWLQQVYRSSNTRLDLNQGTQTVLYDADKSVLADLKEHLVNLSFYQELKHLPVVLQDEADETLILELLKKGSPSVSFLNPFSGSFSQQILLRALKDGHSDLFMLFSLEEMKAALKKTKAGSLLQEFFGDRFSQIKEFQKKTREANRIEEFLLDSLESVLIDKCYYTFRFRVNRPDKKQTSYYLVFASKDGQAYTKLKELILAYSDFQEDGVPLFGANLMQQQTSLFHEHYKYSIANLVQDLSQKAHEFNNKALQQIYEKHNIGTLYTFENYKVAFEKLMRMGKVRFINPKTGQPISKLTQASLVRYSS